MRKSIIIISLLLTVSFLMAVENVTEYKLPNNLTVILKPMKKVPLVTFQIWIKAGSIWEYKWGGAGISHFLEHMLFTSTKSSSTHQIAKRVKQLGCDMNGYTSFERTVYHFTLPSENVSKIIPIAKEMIFMPAFLEQQFKKERSVILKEINMNDDDPTRFFSRLLFQSTYENAFYRFPILGYEEVFKKITRKDLTEYYEHLYIPSNIALIVTGDFSVKEMQDLVAKHFRGLKDNFYTKPSLVKEPAQKGYKEVNEYRNDIVLPRIAMVFKTVDIRHPDLYALDVLSLIMGQGRSSILNEILKEQKQLVKTISSFSYTPMDRGIFSIQAELYNVSDIPKVKSEIQSILADIRKYIKSEDVTKAAKMVLADYFQSLETVEGMAGDLGTSWITTGNIHFSDLYVQGIKKVDLISIEKMVKKYFTFDNLTFITLSPGQGKTTEKAETQEKTDLETYTLPAGLKVIINRDSTVPLVSLRMVFKGGLLFEDRSKYGLTYFTSKMMLRGTENYTRQELIRSIESKGGSIDSFSGNNSFGVSLDLLKEDVKQGLEILSEIARSSTCPDNEIEKVRQEILNEIRAQDEQIFTIGKKILFQEIYKDYPYSVLNTGLPDTINSISRDDIVSHYKYLCRPENCVLSISGDVSPDIKDLIKKYFQEFNTRTDKRIDEPPFSIPTKIDSIETNLDKKQSLLLIAFYGMDVRDSQREKSDILWNILNGQGSRIFDAVREKKGLAYYAGMFPFYGLTTGLYVFYAGTVADKVNTAKKEIVQQIEKLVKNGITKQEMESAKAEAKASKLREFQSNNSISLNYALDELYGLKIKTVEHYNQDIDSISKSEMDQFIKKYFNKKKYSIITIKSRGAVLYNQ
ncbi:MAG: insulinase family protein [Spirochaetes bacterium]|nr:insulinase family protein [Spirochaetota bacterium]